MAAGRDAVSQDEESPWCTWIPRRWRPHEADLTSRDIDVVRLGYSDLIGAERGRDILTHRFARTVGDGVAFCRSVYGTSPMGDVVDIEGGMSAGLPDVVAVPDVSTLQDGPVGARRRAHDRRRVQPRRLALPGEPAQRAAARARAVRRAGHEADRRPGARVLRPGAATESRLTAGSGTARRPATSTRPATRATRRTPCSARCASSRRTGSTSWRRTTSSPRASSRSTCGTPRPSRRPTGPSGSRPRSRSWPACRASWRPSWPSRSTTRVAPGFHLHFSTWSDDGEALFDDPTGEDGLSDDRAPRRRRRARARAGAGGAAQPDDQLLQAVRPRHPGAVADRLGSGQPQRDDPDPTGAWPRLADGAAARGRVGQPVPRDRLLSSAPRTWASATSSSRRPSSRATATTRSKAELLPGDLGTALDALEADTDLRDLLGPEFVADLRGLQAQRDRAVPQLRHRLGVPRVQLPPVSPTAQPPSAVATASKAARVEKSFPGSCGVGQLDSLAATTRLSC